MGWSTGSLIMSDIIDGLSFLPDDARADVYEVLIEAFTEYDCDTLDECFDDDLVFKKVYLRLHPEDDDDGFGYDTEDD